MDCTSYPTVVDPTPRSKSTTISGRNNIRLACSNHNQFHVSPSRRWRGHGLGRNGLLPQHLRDEIHSLLDLEGLDDHLNSILIKEKIMGHCNFIHKDYRNCKIGLKIS